MFHLEEIEGDYQKAVDANPDIAKRFMWKKLRRLG